MSDPTLLQRVKVRGKRGYVRVAGREVAEVRDWALVRNGDASWYLTGNVVVDALMFVAKRRAEIFLPISRYEFAWEWPQEYELVSQSVALELGLPSRKLQIAGEYAKK